MQVWGVVRRCGDLMLFSFHTKNRYVNMHSLIICPSDKAKTIFYRDPHCISPLPVFRSFCQMLVFSIGVGPAEATSEFAGFSFGPRFVMIVKIDHLCVASKLGNQRHKQCQRGQRKNRHRC